MAGRTRKLQQNLKQNEERRKEEKREDRKDYKHPKDATPKSTSHTKRKYEEETRSDKAKTCYEKKDTHRCKKAWEKK